MRTGPDKLFGKRAHVSALGYMFREFIGRSCGSVTYLIRCRRPAQHASAGRSKEIKLAILRQAEHGGELLTHFLRLGMLVGEVDLPFKCQNH